MKLPTLLLMLLAAATLNASDMGHTVAYKDGETELEGYVARPMTRDLIKRPAIIIVHNWKGVKAYEMGRADQLAQLGYVAFAADIYGKGVRPTDTKEAGALAGKYKGDVALYRTRLQAAYNEVKARPDVDPTRIVVMGYCFGGTGALELARSGAALAGAVSFHGGLAAQSPEDAKNIKAPVLILHGAVDPFVKLEEIVQFKETMDAAKADYQFVAYAGAVHSFTEKEAGDDPTKGAAYDELADKRSWKLFTSFLDEVFGKSEG